MTKLKDPQKPSGPVTVRDLRVWVDRDLCIGAATCAAVAQRAFTLDGEAKAVFLDTTDEEIDEALIEAAKACPTAAIYIENKKDGKRIFPK